VEAGSEFKFILVVTCIKFLPSEGYNAERPGHSWVDVHPYHPWWDKTTVSVATGQNEYWPIYLSIGNIHISGDVLIGMALSFWLFYQHLKVIVL